jgi:cysteine desulfurase / selenocysteine lyase
VFVSTQSPVRFDAAAVRAHFPILDQEVNGHPLVFLDSAASSQKPRQVLDAVAAYYERDNANVHRGLYELARRSTEAYENARHSLARFINAPAPEELIWTRGTTEAVNLVANTWGEANIGEGDEILLTLLEHHSNIVPWQMLARRKGAHIRYVGIDDQERLRVEDLDGLLSDRTKLVALGHVSNAIGTINPVAHIVEKAHAAGALVLVDGAQATPHLKVDVQALGCDFYALSGHKMCAPMGIGALWGRRELLEAMPPWQGGGEMIDYVGLDHSTWAKVPHKFEAGTPNVGGAVGMAAAIAFLEEIGHDALWAYEQELVAYGLDRLGRVQDLQLFGPRDPAERTAVFSFDLLGVHPHDIATVLDSEGIAIRAGHHCCQPLMRSIGVPATTRASAYIYNTTDDFDRLADALEKARAIFG